MIYINRDPLNKYENIHRVEKLSRYSLIFNQPLDTFLFMRERMSLYKHYKEFRRLSWYDFMITENSLSHNAYYTDDIVMKTLSYYKNRNIVREDKTIDGRHRTNIIKYIKSKTK